MSGKARPSLRRKTLENVRYCNLSETDKQCIYAVFAEKDVAHGQWGQPNRLKDGVGLWRCDQCGEASIRRFKFCPECGAKMDKLKEVE